MAETPNFYDPHIEGENKKSDLQILIDSIKIISSKNPDQSKMTESEKNYLYQKRRSENREAYLKIKEVGLNDGQMHDFLHKKKVVRSDGQIEVVDLSNQDKANQKGILRDIVSDLQNSKISGRQAATLENAGVNLDFLRNQGVVVENEKKDISKINYKDSETLLQEVSDLLDSPASQTRNDLIKSLLKDQWSNLPSDARKKLLEVSASNEPIKMSAEDDLNRIVGMSGVSEETRKNMLRDWQRKHGGVATEAQLQKMEESLNKAKMVESEIQVDEKALGDIREQMIEKFKSYSANSTEQIKRDFETFLNQQKYRLSKLAGKFSDQVESELRAEFTARAELSAVSKFWDGARTMNKDKKALDEISSNQIDNCIRLSRQTYIWLAKTQELDYLERDDVGKMLPETRKKSLNVGIDLALKDIHEQIQSKLNMWSVSTEEALKEKLDEIVLRGKGTISLDAARLAWQLATAECWGADRNDGWISHPVFKLVHPAEWRSFMARNGAPIPGGSRLWVEYKQRHAGMTPDQPMSDSLFASETPKMARVGYETWVDGDDGKAAVRNGNYLRELEKKLISGFTDANLPQTAVMTDLSKANACWSAMEELGKADVNKVSVDLLVKLRGSMNEVFFRQENEGTSKDKMILAKEKSGKLLNSFVKDLIWQVSWSNPNNDQEGEVASMGVLNKLVRDIVYSYIPVDESMRILHGEKGKYSRDGYGGFLGYGATRKESVVEIKNFLKWYNNIIIPETKQALVNGKKRGNDGNYYKNFSVTNKRRDEDMKSEQLIEFLESKMFPVFNFGSGNKWWLS